MCLAQGPQPSDAGKAQTCGPSVSSQALYQNKHIGLALLFVNYEFEASKKCQVSLVVQYIISFTCCIKNLENKIMSLYYLDL